MLERLKKEGKRKDTPKWSKQCMLNGIFLPQSHRFLLLSVATTQRSWVTSRTRAQGLSMGQRKPGSCHWEMQVNPGVSSQGLSMVVSVPPSELPATIALGTCPAEIINTGCIRRSLSPFDASSVCHVARPETQLKVHTMHACAAQGEALEEISKGRRNHEGGS